VDHLEGLGLAVAGEVAVDVDLAEGLAEFAVDCGGAALPAGALGGLAFEDGSVEGEVFGVEGWGRLEAKAVRSW
jgi:hypothetical protein